MALKNTALASLNSRPPSGVSMNNPKPEMQPYRPLKSELGRSTNQSLVKHNYDIPDKLNQEMVLTKHEQDQEEEEKIQTL